MITLRERAETAELSRERVSLEEKEEEYRLRRDYGAALVANNALFYVSMQLLARIGSSFEKSFIHDTIQRYFFYQAQLNNLGISQ